MNRIGAMGLFVVMLAACQLDSASERTTTSDQAVSTNLCRGMVPTPVEWDGSNLEPTNDHSTYVYFEVNHSSAGKASSHLFALVDTDIGEIERAFFVKSDAAQLSAVRLQLATDSVHVPGRPPQPCVRMLAREAGRGDYVPGNPPDPCVRESNLCAQAIVDIAIE